MSPELAEFIGTTILILLGVGVNANTSLNKTYGQNAGWIVITFGWGFAVFMESCHLYVNAHHGCNNIGIRCSLFVE